MSLNFSSDLAALASLRHHWILQCLTVFWSDLHYDAERKTYAVRKSVDAT